MIILSTNIKFCLFSVLSNSLPKHQNPAINPLQNPLNKQTILKNQHQTQSLQHLLSQHKNDFNAPDQVDPMHHMLNSLNHQPITPPVGILPSVPPVQTHPSKNATQNNSFQSLMMQLQMQKSHIMPQVIFFYINYSRITDSITDKMTIFICLSSTCSANSATSTINHYECNEYTIVADVSSFHR